MLIFDGFQLTLVNAGGLIIKFSTLKFMIFRQVPREAACNFSLLFKLNLQLTLKINSSRLNHLNHIILIIRAVSMEY